MSNFAINFSHPWLLFLLIPAVVLLVVAMLRVPKKYRNTRNRVISVTLEAIVFFCVILLLSGITFTYTTGNSQNEILLLVDVTDTMDSCAETRDEYIQDILYQGEDDGCKMGIVTFGFTQVYAAPLSTDAEKIYSQYKSAELPDTSATDIASALEYACKLFTNTEASKIVIISDGKETDLSAVSTLSAISSQGTIVESVYVPSEYEGSDIQILSVDMPEYHVNTGEIFEVTLNIQSNYEDALTVSLNVTDNGDPINLLDDNGDSESGQREIKYGLNTITFKCIVDYKQLNAIRINIDDIDEEILTQNNSYCVYLYIDYYNKILIFQRDPDESVELEATLLGKEDDELDPDEPAYKITKLTLSSNSADALPLTVDELRQYDLIILNNTSNEDMYTGYLYYIDEVLDQLGDYYSYFYTASGKEKSGGGLLPQLLYDYVYTYGGGLLTVGGVGDDVDENENPVANMYKRSDMYGTVLQQMLPVTAINYTPPTGVVIVIDTSGSMGTGDGSLLSYAILGVLQSLDLMSVRDYMGIIEFSSNPHIVMDMQSLMYVSDIEAALNNLLLNPQSGGTVLKSSFEAAINMLQGDDRFERKHIIFVTDGLLSDTSNCESLARSCYNAGISVTAVVVGGGDTGLSNMRSLCELANDNVVLNERYLYDCTDTSNQSKVAESIYADIESTVWEEVNYGTTQIQVSSAYMFSSLTDGLFATTLNESGETVTDRGHLDASLSRFYGTTIKDGASLILTGDYSVPIYAQWSYGAGMVGSYMGDVHNFQSKNGDDTMILEWDSGKQFMINVVDNLMPTEDIRPNGISVSLTEDNYTNRINVYADIQEGYTVDAKIYKCDDGAEYADPVLDLNKVTSGDTDDLDYYVTVAMDESNKYARANFVIKIPGVYRIEIKLLDENGDVVVNDMGVESSATIYKKFSYSAEYNNFNADDGLALMNQLSTGEYGAAITDADELVEVFSGLVTRLTKTVDPRLPLIIVSLVIFLLGIAVRKFKFKWIHEIVRDRRIQKENMQKREVRMDEHGQTAGE